MNTPGTNNNNINLHGVNASSNQTNSSNPLNVHQNNPIKVEPMQQNGPSVSNNNNQNFIQQPNPQQNIVQNKAKNASQYFQEINQLITTTQHNITVLRNQQTTLQQDKSTVPGTPNYLRLQELTTKIRELEIKLAGFQQSSSKLELQLKSNNSPQKIQNTGQPIANPYSQTNSQTNSPIIQNTSNQFRTPQTLNQNNFNQPTQNSHMLQAQNIVQQPIVKTEQITQTPPPQIAPFEYKSVQVPPDPIELEKNASLARTLKLSTIYTKQKTQFPNAHEPFKNAQDVWDRLSVFHYYPEEKLEEPKPELDIQLQQKAEEFSDKIDVAHKRYEELLQKLEKDSYKEDQFFLEKYPVFKEREDWEAEKEKKRQEIRKQMLEAQVERARKDHERQTVQNQIGKQDQQAVSHMQYQQPTQGGIPVATMNPNSMHNSLGAQNLPQTNVYQNNIQQNTIQQNNIQHNNFQRNNFQQNNIPQNNFQQNNIPQNNIQQNNLQQNNIPGPNLY